MLLKGILFALFLVLMMNTIAAVSGSVVLNKIAGIMSIMVWVVLWGPLDSLIYHWHPIRERLQMFERLATIEVECQTTVC